MTTQRTKSSVLTKLVPALTAAALALSWSVLREQGVSQEARDTYFTEVRDAVESVPMTIGPWVGREVELQPAAEEVLNTNIGKQWLFEDLDTGRIVQVLIVHCRNTKDMQGHYPPRCYPNAGWTYDEQDGRELTTVPFGFERAPATTYEFSVFDEGSVRTLHVLNFLALPAESGAIEPDLAGVNRASRSRVTARLGGANVQFLSAEKLDTGPGSVVELFMSELEPAVRTIVEGVSDEP